MSKKTFKIIVALTIYIICLEDNRVSVSIKDFYGTFSGGSTQNTLKKQLNNTSACQKKPSFLLPNYEFVKLKIDFLLSFTFTGILIKCFSL